MKTYLEYLFNSILIYFLIPIVLLFSSCEKVIDIDLKLGAPQIVVDAFINNLPETQVIRLTSSSAYFKNSPSPAVLGAKVVIKNETTGQIFAFTDNDNSGNYTLEFNKKDSLLHVFNNYSLSIIHNGDTLTSRAQMNPVPIIDSLTYEYKKGLTEKQNGYIASFWANDIPNRTDFYWIKSFRNDKLLNEPKYLNYAWDASFEGWQSDGNQFFGFTRQAITPYDKPFLLNDKVKVQIYSINEPTFRFLNLAKTQLNNEGLFATAPVNLKTNIINKNSKSASKPVGWFVVSSVSEKVITIHKE
jgi:Domain of unknown function (DUF4249)